MDSGKNLTVSLILCVKGEDLPHGVVVRVHGINNLYAGPRIGPLMLYMLIKCMLNKLLVYNLQGVAWEVVFIF